LSEINVLSEDLANKIAAGEVIERPVSIVKELIENAIDANASRIKIEIKDGGKKLIKISDNGKGISKEDLPKAILRHATSKIKDKNDLFRIATLGFRGEALPSIASVSRMGIISNKDGKAYNLSLQTTPEGTLKECSSTKGTIVTVEDLFYNLPARLKFLKGDSTEFSHIQTYVKKLTLSRPDISFTLLNNDKVSFETQGIKDNPLMALKNAMSRIYGKDSVTNSLEINLEAENLKAWGIISAPEFTKSDKKGQNIFVNERLISSPIVTRAADDALRDILPHGRYPYFSIFLDIPPELVDVNVHPSKKEVRFANGNIIFNFVKSAIKNTFLATEINRSKETALGFKDRPVSFQNISEPREFQPQIFSKETLGGNNITNSSPFEPSSQTGWDPHKEIYKKTNPVEDPGVVVLGQANRSWIIILDNEDLLLIDQHAAHERINYERLKNNTNKEQMSQGLLIPLNIELSETQIANLSLFSKQIIDLGFDFELFSDTSALLRTIPQGLKTDLDYQEIFKDIIDDLEGMGSTSSKEKVMEALIKMAACKASIKAGQTLTYMEMKQLVGDLYKTNNYLTCPHGRPTITAISDEELRKKFHRT